MAIIETNREYRSYPIVDTRILANAALLIKDRQIKFRELSVEQIYGDHHSFSVEVPFNI